MNKVNSFSERLYQLLIRLYPEKYREEYGEQMLLDFSDMYRESRMQEGQTIIFHLWSNVMSDYLSSLAREHIYEKIEGEYIMKKQFDILGLIFWALLGMLVFPLSFITSMFLVTSLGISIESQFTWIIFITLLLLSLIGSQWFILKKYTKSARNWLLNNSIAWIVIFAFTFVFFQLTTNYLSLNMEVTDQSSILIIQLFQALVYGSILGLFQQKSLKEYRNTWLLIPANIIALMLVLVSINSSIKSTFDMIIIGAYPAIFTGLSLLLILKNSPNRKRMKIIK